MEAQQEAESRLIQAAKLAAVGEMAAGVAHELNNPLTTVMGFTELVLGELPAESPYQKELGMVLREARRASEVVRRLLDFSRQGERVRARANLNEIVDDVIALTRHLIHTNGVSLALFLANDLPWVSVDRNQMKQVLLNLVHNALQAMPSGGELCIRTVSQKRDGMDWVTLSVQDSGVGIQPKDKEKIFEPFFTTKADRGGTGLGLSVSYSIVADHGGFIEVESEAKKGSVFTVWLPI
jgi:two-component system NtrC family sensor kinase